MNGAVSHLSGLSAEERVAEHYARSGGIVRHRRWRGKGGEIDLIVNDGAVTVFVEVKKARRLAEAAERLTPHQVRRVMVAAEEFVAGEPSGAMTQMRFDVALVDGMGRIEVIENALSA